MNKKKVLDANHATSHYEKSKQNRPKQIWLSVEKKWYKFKGINPQQFAAMMRNENA